MQMTLTQRDAWLDALNSGKYPQTTGCLQDSNGFCCLGVLESVEGTDSEIEYYNARCGKHTFIGDGRKIQNSFDRASLILTTHTSEKYKTKGWGPDIPLSLLTDAQEAKIEKKNLDANLSLPNLNDAGITFSEIAVILKQVIKIVPEKEVS